MANRTSKWRGSRIDRMVGARVRERRLKLGLEVRELAKRCGVSKAQLARYESGVTSLDSNRLALLASALRVAVGYFFREPQGVSESTEPAVPERPERKYARTPEEASLLKYYRKIADDSIRTMASRHVRDLSKILTASKTGAG